MRWILFTICFASAAAFAQPTVKNYLRPFSTDYCTLFPDGSWNKCCIDHDYAYWKGGTKEDRKKCDKELKRCVKEAKNSFLGEWVYLGVRLYSHIDGPRHWGYGWAYNRGYKPLGPKELSMTEQIKPLAIYQTPKGEGQSQLPYPTQSGNYCFDQILDKIKMDKNQDLKIGYLKTDFPGRLRVYTNQCKGFYMVQFKVMDFQDCVTPMYVDEAPSLLISIRAHGKCQVMERN